MPLDPVTGTLLATAFGSIWNSFAVGRANRYNSPRQQLRRLREAGLPLAYMYEGNVGQQSEVPRLSIDPDLGAAESAGLKLERSAQDLQAKYQNAQITKMIQEIEISKDLTEAQKQKMIAEIEKMKADIQLRKEYQEAQIPAIQEDIKYQQILNEIKSGERDWLMSLATVPQGTLDNNQVVALNLQQQEKLTNSFIARHKERIAEIAANVEDVMYKEGVTQGQRRAMLKKANQELINLMSQDSLLKQMYDIRGIEQVVNQSILDSVNTMPDWLKATWGILMKIFGPGVK